MTKNERLTIGLTTIGLLVGGLSLWISRENSKLQRAEAAPHLVVLGADFARPTPYDPRSLVAIFKVVNRGKIGVRITESHVHPKLLALPTEDSLRPCYEHLDSQDFQAKDSGVEEKIGINGPPGIISVLIQLPQDCPNTGWTFVGTVDFIGLDDARHRYDSRESTDAPLFKAALPNK